MKKCVLFLLLVGSVTSVAGSSRFSKRSDERSTNTQVSKNVQVPHGTSGQDTPRPNGDWTDTATFLAGTAVGFLLPGALRKECGGWLTSTAFLGALVWRVSSANGQPARTKVQAFEQGLLLGAVGDVGMQGLKKVGRIGKAMVE